MPLIEHLSHASQLGKFMGLDLGTKTIGLALSDHSRTIASPLRTIKRTKFTKDARLLLELIDQNEVSALIIGLPLNMNGSAGPRVQATKAFMRNLTKLHDMDYFYWDERLSTQAVKRTLLDADISRHKRADKIDKMAASFILQGALDHLGYQATPST